MDAAHSFKPVPLAAIGRSGTFIIESAADKDNENDDIVVKPKHDQPKVPVVHVPQPGEQIDPCPDDGEKALLDVTTKDDEGKLIEVDTVHNTRRSLDVNVESQEEESGDATAKTGRRKSFGICRSAKGGSLDVSARWRESSNAITELGKERSLDTPAENIKIKGLDAATRNGNADQSNFTRKNGRRASKNGETELFDAITRNDTAESSDATSKAETFDITIKNGKKESPDVTPKTGRRESLDAFTESSKTESWDVIIKDDKVESSEAKQKEEAHDITVKNGTKESLDVKTEHDQNDNSEEEGGPETKRDSKFPFATLKRVTVDEPVLTEEAPTNKKTPSNSETPEEHSEQTDQDVVTEFLQLASLSTSESSLAAEKERPIPIPAPRKSVTKIRDEPADKYSLLRTELQQRWQSVAFVPKYQSIDPRTRMALQEQADRRLAALCPPNYEEDFTALLNKVERALEHFYNQTQLENDSHSDGNGIRQGLPSLRFLQWILPALDKQEQNLLFGCDVLRFIVK